MAVRVERIEMDEYNRVSAINFSVDSNPQDVLAFLRDFKIGRNFADFALKEGQEYKVDTQHMDALKSTHLTMKP